MLFNVSIMFYSPTCGARIQAQDQSNAVLKSFADCEFLEANTHGTFCIKRKFITINPAIVLTFDCMTFCLMMCSLLSIYGMQTTARLVEALVDVSGSAVSCHVAH